MKYELLGKPLGKRELEVLSLTAKGYKAPEIAGMLRITKSAVADYRRTARMKLGARTSAESIYEAFQQGIFKVMPNEEEK